MKFTDCSILIPTRNRPGILATTLRRLLETGLGNLPLWVYDDASEAPEETRAVLDAWPGAGFIAGDRRSGQAAGRNSLLKACGTKYAICLDDDQYFLQLGNLAEYIASGDPKLAAVAFQCRAIRDGRLDVPAAVGPRSAPSFMGGAVLFQVPVILGLDGYREFWCYGGEEGELALRISINGFRIHYDPSIVVEHNQHYTADENRDFREYDFLYSRNAVLLMSMNSPIWFGLPMGVAKSLRRLLDSRRNLRSRLAGTFAGVAQSITLWPQRTPASSRAVLKWLEFNRNWTEV